MRRPRKVDLSPEDLMVELLSREEKPAPVFLDEKFLKQNDFVMDDSRLLAAICTRRAGKTYALGKKFCRTALAFPSSDLLYLALSRDSAKAIFWRILHDLDKLYSLNCKFNETELTMRFPNGAILYVKGSDKDSGEMEKWRGWKLSMAAIDESASFTVDLEALVYKILRPASADLKGQIVLIGTPGNLVKGLFYDVTNGKEPGWAVHRWTAFDNPYVDWEGEIRDLLSKNPLRANTPSFRQEYYGEWTVDESGLCYHFQPGRNAYTALPALAEGTWHYALGVDLGYSPDPSAFVVVAYHDYDTHLYVLETYKELEMDLTDVARRIKQYQATYDLDTIIIDNANKQAVEEIKHRHGIALRAADKVGKSDFMHILDDELIQGKVLLNVDRCKGLVDEMSQLIWDERSEVQKEDSRCENHECDALLYAWRYCYQWLSEQPPKKVKIGTPEWFKAQENEHEEQLLRELERRQADGWGKYN